MTFSPRKKDFSICMRSRMTIQATLQAIRFHFKKYFSHLPLRNQQLLSSSSLQFKLKFLSKAQSQRQVLLSLLKSPCKKENQRLKETKRTVLKRSSFKDRKDRDKDKDKDRDRDKDKDKDKGKDKESHNDKIGWRR